MTIGFATVNGSPGTNSIATAAARYWADHSARPAVVVSADELGGPARSGRPRVDKDVLIDLGRLRPASPGVSMAENCDLLVVAVGTEMNDMITLLSRMEFFHSLAPVELVLVGEGPYPVDELRRMTEVDQIHVVPLSQLSGQYDAHAVRERRRAWSRAVRRLTTHLIATGAAEPSEDKALRDWAITRHPSAQQPSVH